jgi:4-hydroxy-tetrahydrodipicolinate synthase
MAMAELKGILTAMVTPFAEDGSVDEAAARSLARHLVDNGSHGVVVAGTTGESPTLSDDEDVALLRAVKDEVGDRATVICGTGTNDTRHSQHLTEAAAEAGADAVLVVTPYYNKPNEAGILAHFEAVAKAAGETPVIVYNIPSRVVVNIEPELLNRLGEIDNIVAVKQAENSQIDEVDGLDVLAGNDDIFLRCLETGGPGGILVASHLVGNEMRRLYDAVQAGDTDKAREIDKSIRPIFDAIAVTNPVPVKAACEMLGLIPSARMRLPMVEADTEQRAALRKALEAHGLLAASAA